MPQMMPMEWLMLFVMFSMTFTLFNLMNYFSHIPMTSNKLMIKKYSKSLNWKW
nr:ATP synthase F0 subunit 8 [Hodotermopsis sjostedti]